MNGRKVRIRGIGTAKRIAGWARSRFRGGPLILGYHQVALSHWDPQRLCVSPKNFSEQLDILTQRAQAISMSQLTKALQEGRNLERSFVVTLDDGYEDTIEAAAPILERFAVPATVFVTTGMIGKPFWWCEIQQMIEESTELPDKIEINVGDHQFHWTKVSDSLKDRARLVRAIGDLFRILPFDHQNEAVARLWSAFNLSPSGTPIKAMTAEQISTLAESDLIEVGSHMVTHTPS